MQLVAQGAIDIMHVRGDDALPANLRSSMANRWFVAREDGQATADDLSGGASGSVSGYDDGSVAPEVTKHAGILWWKRAWCLGETHCPDDDDENNKKRRFVGRGDFAPLILPPGFECVSIRRERAAHRIQDAWRAAITDPAFATCRRRLAREYRELRT
jgi:hypothetical protein